LSATIPFSSPKPAHDAVVVLHGLFASTRSMEKVCRRLSDVGYRAINWGYPTLCSSVETTARRLQDTLHALQQDTTVRTINFLTHSMGGIIARQLIQHGSIDKIRRMVMLAPPNAGSHLTRVSLGPFRGILPAIEQIRETTDSFVNQLNDLRGVEVGVIAAARDFIVRVENTRLAEQRDHRVIPCTHFGLPKCDTAIGLSLDFLKHGGFERPQESAKPEFALSDNAIPRAA